MGLLEVLVTCVGKYPRLLGEMTLPEGGCGLEHFVKIVFSSDENKFVNLRNPNFLLLMPINSLLAFCRLLPATALSFGPHKLWVVAIDLCIWRCVVELPIIVAVIINSKYF